jgi:hypothetical protein
MVWYSDCTGRVHMPKRYCARSNSKAGLKSWTGEEAQIGKQLEEAIRGIRRCLDTIEAILEPMIEARLRRRKPPKDK